MSYSKPEGELKMFYNYWTPTGGTQSATEVPGEGEIQAITSFKDTLIAIRGDTAYAYDDKQQEWEEIIACWGEPE